MTIAVQKIARAAVALAAALAANVTMAATATVLLDAPLMATNGVTATAVGSNTYTSSTGKLLTQIDAANTVGDVIDFGNADGFKLAFKILGFSQTATFSNFSFNTETQVLSGNLLGTGVIASAIDYTNGDLLIANSLLQVGDTWVASGFSVTSAFASYLESKDISTAQLSAVTSVLKTVTLPVTPAVPEPSTYAMMGVGLVGIALVARRKNRQA